ncbi:Hypothetical predicted protein, partial [Mytilus galloprovincialis]
MNIWLSLNNVHARHGIYVGHEANTTIADYYKLSYDTRNYQNKTILGVFEWTVTGKVTDFGQNVTLFCHVPNCCPKDAGWDRWTPVQQTLFIDVKTGRPNKKYDGKVFKDGYTLVIQNLTKEDLNVSYSCIYDVTFGQSQFLLEEDVFTDKSDMTPNDGLSKIQIAGIILGIAVTVAVAVVVFVIFNRKKRNKQPTNEEGMALLEI